jgi:PAS domain-containing protein
MYAELYDLAPIAYFTFDASGEIQEVNNACAHLLDIKIGELVKKHFAVLLLMQTKGGSLPITGGFKFEVQ